MSGKTFFLVLLTLVAVFSAQALAQKITYQFDEVEVLYATRFTVYSTQTSIAAWAEEIAAPGEEITITYGIVILKAVDNATGVAKEAMREEWLKAEGSRGSRRLLSNSGSNSFNPGQTQIAESKTQLWSAKKLVGTSIEKDFTEPVYNAYLFRKLVGSELAPTHVCFRTGANFDDFWGKTSTEDCYSTKAFLKEVGDDKETAGQKPPNAPPAVRPACAQPYSCMPKQDGTAGGCVVLASFACANEPAEYCFKCPELALPAPTPTPAPAPSAAPSEVPSPSPSPSPTPTESIPTPSPSPTLTPSPSPTPTPSVVPSTAPTPSPSPSPTPSPSENPSPSPEPSPSASPPPPESPSPSPSPSPEPSPSPTA